MSLYTVFCQAAGGNGTIWVSTVEAENLPDAVQRGREQCVVDWGYSVDVHVLGVAAGDVEILMWEDQQ